MNPREFCRLAGQLGFEYLVVEVSAEYSGPVMRLVQERQGECQKMEGHGSTTQIEFQDHRITKFRLLIFDYPREFGVCLALALAFWIAYHALRGRLRGPGGW